MDNEDYLEKLIASGIKIKAGLDRIIQNENDECSFYPKTILAWNTQCLIYLKKEINSDLILYGFTKNDDILIKLKRPTNDAIFLNEMFSVLEVRYSLKKEPSDIINIIKDKIDFLLSAQGEAKNKASNLSKPTNSIEYIYNQSEQTGALTIHSNDSILFKGRHATILDFFYHAGSGEYKNCDDYNKFQMSRYKLESIGTKKFSLAITRINETVHKNTTIKEIIVKKPRSHSGGLINFYKWKF